MILVFGGTSDSLTLAEALKREGYEYLLSVATTYGKALAQQKASHVIEGRLNQEEMKQLIEAKQVDYIIDATHPYALEVSQNVMAVAEEMMIGYLRYERPSLLEEVKGPGVHIVQSNKEACEVANKLGQNVFLGTGSKTLGEFVHGLKDKKIVARVLPTSEVILQCEALGLSPENIIGMKGPFSEAMNVALYRQYKIDCMITKESGQEGGFLEKVAACKKQGIEIIVIKRGTLNYPKVASRIDEVIKVLKEISE